MNTLGSEPISAWISSTPMTPRIKLGSHRELIFQEAHIYADFEKDSRQKEKTQFLAFA